MCGAKEENRFQKHIAVTKELRLAVNPLFQPMFKLVPKVLKFRNSIETLSKVAIKVPTHHFNGLKNLLKLKLEMIN